MASRDKLAARNGAVELDDELIEIHGLGDVIVGSQPHGFDDGAAIAVRGHDDDGHVDAGFAGAFQNGETIEAGHADVEQAGIEGPLHEGGEGLRPVFRLDHAIAAALEQFRQGDARGSLVFGDQDGSVNFHDVLS